MAAAVVAVVVVLMATMAIFTFRIVTFQDGDVLLLLFSDGVHEQVTSAAAVKVTPHHPLPLLPPPPIAYHFRLLALPRFKAEIPRTR